MLNFFFTVPSEFAVSHTVQAINDILFPIVLFVFIFFILCNVFIDSPQQKVIVDIDESVATDESNEVENDNNCLLEQYSVSAAAVIEEHQRSTTKVELFDVDQERNRLCCFGVRKLRAYCKQHRLKGLILISDLIPLSTDAKKTIAYCRVSSHDGKAATRTSSTSVICLLRVS